MREPVCSGHEEGPQGPSDGEQAGREADREGPLGSGELPDQAGFPEEGFENGEGERQAACGEAEDPFEADPVEEEPSGQHGVPHLQGPHEGLLVPKGRRRPRTARSTCRVSVEDALV